MCLEQKRKQTCSLIQLAWPSQSFRVLYGKRFSFVLPFSKKRSKRWRGRGLKYFWTVPFYIYGFGDIVNWFDFLNVKLTEITSHPCIWTKPFFLYSFWDQTSTKNKSNNGKTSTFYVVELSRALECISKDYFVSANKKVPRKNSAKQTIPKIARVNHQNEQTNGKSR